jgi:hypothetical protein
MTVLFAYQFASGERLAYYIGMYYNGYHHNMEGMQLNVHAQETQRKRTR